MADFIPSTDRIDRLRHRVVAKGGSVEGVVFERASDKGWGVFSARALARGTALMSIPFSECISVEAVQSSPLGEVFEDNPDLLSSPDEVMCLALMYTLGNEESIWHDHVQTFPSSFNSSLHWTDAELERLRPCMTYNLSRLILTQMRHDWENIHRPLKEQFPHLLSAASFENYLWAISVVYSRALGLHRRGEYVRVIAPLLDMANHNPFVASQTADTFAYVEEEDAIKFVSAVDVEVGEECFAVYGEYPNSKLALNYGFVIYKNPQQRIDLWTKLLPNTGNYQEKRLLIEACELTKNQTYDFEGTLINGEISKRLLATIRIIQMTHEELSSYESAISVEMGNMVSVRNERATYASLRELLASRLGDTSRFNVGHFSLFIYLILIRWTPSGSQIY